MHAYCHHHYAGCPDGTSIGVAEVGSFGDASCDTDNFQSSVSPLTDMGFTMNWYDSDAAAGTAVTTIPTTDNNTVITFTKNMTLRQIGGGDDVSSDASKYWATWSWCVCVQMHVCAWLEHVRA
jgi:hypothetical protein